MLAVIDQAKATIRTQARQSVFTLTDVANTSFNSKMSDAMKEFVIHNKTYIVYRGIGGRRSNGLETDHL